MVATSAVIQGESSDCLCSVEMFGQATVFNGPKLSRAVLFLGERERERERERGGGGGEMCCQCYGLGLF